MGPIIFAAGNKMMWGGYKKVLLIELLFFCAPVSHSFLDEGKGRRKRKSHLLPPFSHIPLYTARRSKEKDNKSNSTFRL